jgi:hypothetical protein
LLRGYVHPNTSVIAGDGLVTDVGVYVGLDNGKPVRQMIRNQRGDATVSISAAASLPLKGRPDLKIEERQRQLFVDGVPHSSAFNWETINGTVWAACRQVLQCAEPLRRSAAA